MVGCTGRYWAVLGGTRPYWAVLDCTRLVGLMSLLMMPEAYMPVYRCQDVTGTVSVALQARHISLFSFTDCLIQVTARYISNQHP